MSTHVFGDTKAITARVLDRAARGDRLDASAVTFLLRQYRDADRADLSDAIGAALADALERYADESDAMARAAWLRLFAEAAAISDDGRLADAVRASIVTLVAAWPSAVAVDEAAASVDACLAASYLDDPETLIPAAIDELERVVGSTYRPGVGVAHVISAAPHVRGGFSDQIHTASALLTAYELTGRLPYSMLAEELMQLSSGEAATQPDVALTCHAVRVLCRLAALHDDDEYRRAAVIADAADYRGDAERLLAGVSDQVAERGTDAALYGIALGEWRARTGARGETP